MNTPTVLRTVLVAAALALGSAVVVFALAGAGTTAPLVPLVAVVAAAWYGGIPCGLLTTAFATALVPLALPPFLTFEVPSSRDVVRIGLLVVLGSTATLMVARFRRTAETLGATLASIGDGVLVTDETGCIVSLNGVAERLTGWTTEEARGRRIEEVFVILNEQTRQPAVNPVTRVLAEGVVVGLANHTVLVSRDGTERAVDDSGAPIRHHSGRIVGAVLVFRDDSARRRAERTAATNEQRFRALVEASSEIVWAMDTSGAFIEDSQSWRDFTGQTVEEIRGRGWLDAVHEDDRERVASEFSSAVEHRLDHFQATFRIRHASGGWRWVESRGVPIQYDGSAGEWVGMTVDVTEVRRAEEDRRESEERFRTLADTAPVLMWVNGLASRDFVNREYLRFTGLSAEQATGTEWTRIVHPEDIGEYLEVYRAAAERQEQFAAQYRCRRFDGEYRWLKSVGVPRFSTGGEFLGYVGVSLDITDLKQAEEVLQRASRTKDEFIATVSHELRTPLNAILGWAMLLRGSADQTHLSRGLETIDRNARALARIIEDILDFSRTSRGELRVDRVPLDLREVLRHVVGAVDVMAVQKGVTLVVEDLQPAMALGDAMRLQQVITNLLSNAIKFTPAGGRVTLRLAQEDGTVVLSVKDTGIGIPPDHLKAIFDPFRQVTPHVSGGLGLGLAIVRHIVEAHEGIVEASSDGEGRGATFTVKLPAAPEAAADEPAPV